MTDLSTIIKHQFYQTTYCFLDKHLLDDENKLHVVL